MDRKEILTSSSSNQESTTVPLSPSPLGIRITVTPPDARNEDLDQLDVDGILEDRRSGTLSPVSSEPTNRHHSDDELSPPPFRALFDESHPIAPSPLYASMMTVTGDVGRDVGNTSPHEPPYGTLSTVGNLPPIVGISIGTSNVMMPQTDQNNGNSSSAGSLAGGLLHPNAFGTFVSSFATSSIGMATATTIATPENISSPPSRPQSEPPDLVTIEDSIEVDEETNASPRLIDARSISDNVPMRHYPTLVESVVPKDENSLRRIILRIQTNPILSSVEKAKKVQHLMMSRWTSKHNSNTPGNGTNKPLPMELEIKMDDQSTTNTTEMNYIPQSPWIMPATMSAPNLLHTMGQASGQSHSAMMLDGVNISILAKESSELELDSKEFVDTHFGLGINVTSPSDYIEKVIRPLLSQQDLTPTLTPVHGHSQGWKVVTFGCKHYASGCKIFTPCCMKWFSCRYCHDEVMHASTIASDINSKQQHSTTHQHSLSRFIEHESSNSESMTFTSHHPTIKYIMCQKCQQIQLSSMMACTKCGLQFGSHYTCAKCVIWENDPKKKIYHCQSCQVCRIGDPDEYFHCAKCDCCLRVDLRGNHKCIERSLHCDCPICGEYLFYSTTSIIFMPCGHAIHYLCHQQHAANSYQCPICWKSLVNMKVYFARLDQMLSEHKMPEEYASVMSNILCNDCEKRSDALYHFMYHKCKYCGSYNTKLLSTFIMDQDSSRSITNDSINQIQDVTMDTSDDIPDAYEHEDIS